MTPDTSTEAVERLAKEIQTIRWPLEEGCRLREDAAATLHALLAERDVAKADLLAAVKQVAADGRLRGTAEAERDALAAERDRLAEAVAALDAAHAQAAREVERLREALEGTLSAMNAVAAEAAGDMTDADTARLWNAAVAQADAALAGEGRGDG